MDTRKIESKLWDSGSSDYRIQLSVIIRKCLSRRTNLLRTNVLDEFIVIANQELAGRGYDRS